MESRRLTVELGLPGGIVRVEMDVPMGEVPMERLLPALRTTADAFVAYGAEISVAAGKPVSCAKGCGACCRQLVPLAHAEARQLATLVEELPEPRRSVVKERFADALRRVEAAGLLPSLKGRTGRLAAEAVDLGLDYFRLGIACPFLEDESCSIYHDRPIACREYLVTSPPACCAAPTAETDRGGSPPHARLGRGRARGERHRELRPGYLRAARHGSRLGRQEPRPRDASPRARGPPEGLRTFLARPQGRGIRTMTVEAGRKLGRYVLSRKIGAGGMAEVWEAFDEGLHRSVAVKVVRDEIAGEAEFHERFIREARLAAQLEHPRILPIYDFGTEGGVTYLVMPLLPGGSLKEQISGPMPADEAVEALAAIAAALDHAHGRGVLHRDVKPSNVLVDASGSLLLADFGLAKNTAVSSELTVAGMVVGTPAYMAPEQAIGRPVDARADQYALGIVAFELLTGRTPFRSESPFAILDKHLREAPPPPSSFVPDLPPEVDAVLARALAKQPQERFGTCRQMVEALAAALGTSMPLRPSTAVRAARPPDQTWIADTAATLPPVTPRPTRSTPRPAHLTLPAPQTAVTARRPAPTGPSSNAVVAAIVVVALLFIGVAAGVGWTLFGPKGMPVEPPAGGTALPTPAPIGTVPPPTPETAGTGEAPAEGTPAGDASVPADDSSRVTIEELGVPTMPPAVTPRATPVPVRSAATGLHTAAPTSAPLPVPVPPTAEPQRPTEPASSVNPAARLERVVPFRTKESVPVGIEDRFITIESVEVTSWPKPDEVRKAESKPDETTSLTVKFTYMNRDDNDWKCIYRVSVLDDGGREIGSGVQERTLNGTEAGDTNRVSVKMRTLDFPKAVKLRVRILARPD